MKLRDHAPIEISEFQGLWDRGDIENVPIDHFTDANNLDFIGGNVKVRPGLGVSQTVAVPLGDIKRFYNYATQTANTTLVLVDDAGTGKIYHVINASTVHGPILSIVGMEDFAFVPYAGRAYISPFKSFTTGDLNIQKGLQNEFVYVYNGDGTAARKAAGATPAGSLTVANGAAGNTDPGLHIFAVVGETNSGFLSRPVAFANFTTLAALSVSFSTVPLFTGAQWTKRHIVATKVIPSYNGNQEGYQFFFIANATINDNVTTTLANISFFDADLLEDASHLIDNYTEIPAGAAMWLYHNRMFVACTFTDISLAIGSAAGEPEAISQIDGLVIVPPDGNPITNGIELRDIMYIFKRAKTVGFNDNGEEPSFWPDSGIDTALGTSVHGIATVLDSGGANVDYLIIATYSGILLFNGRYIVPELSWKIENFWSNQDRNEYRKIQIVNCPPRQKIYIVIPDGRLLVGDYSRGMNPKNIRWLPWNFDQKVNAVAIVNIDEILIGMDIP